jgi:hypothetical protein
MVTGVTTSYMPTGWLLMLKMGFLHRGINIGNVLMVDPPVTKPFEAWTIEPLVTQLRPENNDEPTGHFSLLENAIKELGCLSRCCGFIIDGGTAARLEGYFTPREIEEKSVGMPNYAGNLTDVIPRREHTSSCPGNWCAL